MVVFLAMPRSGHAGGLLSFPMAAVSTPEGCRSRWLLPPHPLLEAVTEMMLPCQLSYLVRRRYSAARLHDASQGVVEHVGAGEQHRRPPLPDPVWTAAGADPARRLPCPADYRMMLLECWPIP